MAEPTTRTAGQVARLLGVPESTLRAWHRRYGVEPRAARPGGYRRYTEQDVARLRRMHELVSGGMLPSEAARVVAAAVVGRPPPQLLGELVAAACALDSARCLDLLEQGLAGGGVVELWEALCRPALAEIDAVQRAERGPAGECVDREHVLSWAITATLHRVGRVEADDGARVLLACADAEQHTLPLEALAAALAERRVPVRMLGAAVPTASLVHAVTAARPEVVVLWAHRPPTDHPPALAALRDVVPRRVAAGPGWSTPHLHGATRVATLPEALALLAGPAHPRR